MNPTLTDTFRRLLAEHGDPVTIDLRPVLIDEVQTNPSVVVVDYRRPEPLHRALDLHAAIGRMDATFSATHTIADMAADATDWPVYLPAPKRWPASPAPSRTRAPKPPPDVQDAIQATAEDRRDRKRVRNLRNIGHSADCAMDMAIGRRPCSCSKEAPNV